MALLHLKINESKKKRREEKRRAERGKNKERDSYLAT